MGSGDLKPRTGKQIREAFLGFFAERGHQVMPSSSLIPKDPTVLLTIAGMLPFKPVFLGQAQAPSPRVTTSQKCIRTNDIENVGNTARHHTFFEMLGNFSFGDYFKKEAIQWAWELSTDVYGLDPNHLVISVFREDQEAEEIWREVVGVSPERIVRMDEEDNFWASGPTGPCGPCSEMYFDFSPEMGTKNFDLNNDSRFIEFYNLVFMQYNRDAQGKLTLLDNCNIDTGMGLERMAQILQVVPNNYETDLIFPLVHKAADLASIDYIKTDDQRKISLKVIGDHLRAVTHLISDGVFSSNVGRGYILRRLIRRIVRHGRLIGINKPFLNEMGLEAIHLMQTAFPELLERQDVILQELNREENRFLETLERGEKLLADIIGSQPNQISGAQAFELYDTFGFPLELTEEIAQENNLTVDIAAFNLAMENQRERAKASAISIDLTVQDVIDQIASNTDETDFQGYESLELKARVLALVVNGKESSQGSVGDQVQVVLDTTPFYGEAGGQIGDKGFIESESSSEENCIVSINNVSRNKNIFVHSGVINHGVLTLGDAVFGKVDPHSRKCAKTNHTATHLLQAALKQIINSNISQAGSLVSFERLRFDFNSPRSIHQDELDQIEQLINQWIADAHPLKIQDMTIQQAKELGAIAMFGEKYGDIVRVVNVPGVSMELCGGTHVTNTSELGIFKIISETGIASGIRRIEAVAGISALNYLKERDLVVQALADRLKVPSNQIVDRIIVLQDEMKSVEKALRVAKDELAYEKIQALKPHIELVGNKQILVQRLDGLDGSTLQKAAQSLIDQLGVNSAVVFGGLPETNDLKKIIFVAAFGSGIISKELQAGKFIGSIAQICGGGGGGRPNLAQAGGREIKALDGALKFALDQLKQSLG